jgi:hypothetical protein
MEGTYFCDRPNLTFFGANISPKSEDEIKNYAKPFPPKRSFVTLIPACGAKRHSLVGVVALDAVVRDDDGLPADDLRVVVNDLTEREGVAGVENLKEKESSVTGDRCY